MFAKPKGEILITGACGFIGANMAHRLVGMGCRPHLVVKQVRHHWRIKPIFRQAHIHECDLTNKKKVDQLVRRIRPKYIFHFASYGNYPFQTDAKKIIQTNILGTFHLVNACLESGFRFFLNSGSSSEYGFKDFPCDEKTLPEPNSDYAWSKLASTLYCRYAARAHKMPIVTFRFYSVYGPYEEPSRLIPTLTRCCFEKKLPALVSPSIARDFIHIDDVIDLCLLTIRKRISGGEIFNIGTAKQSTVRDVVSQIMKETNVWFRLRWGSMQNRIWDTAVWVSNNRKVRRYFHWRPRYHFQAGLAQTVHWYQEHPECLYGH